MFAIEDLGLVKIDLLSQRSLSDLADTLEMVKRNGVPVPNLDDGEKVRGDPETRRLIREGRTMGCFYIESPAMRSLLKKLRVDDFEMLTAASSVIRPGVAKSGMMQQFIACHNGLREPTYLHPVMRDILGRTYGVMIYQEDVIKVAHRIAGMSLGEADLLRRAMSGKMRSHEAMKGLRDSFVAGAWRQGVARDMAEEIWRQIKSFAGYAFCKAHSASYALLSFKVAYLKAHHPAEFMAAVITNRGGFYHPTAYIEEARRMGIRILPPDVNLGETAFTGGGKEIRTGLMQVRKVTRRTLLAIEASRRKAGPFTSLRDFRDRTGAGIAEVEQLIRAGAFSSLGATRPELFWRLHLMKGSGYAAVPLFSAARLNGTAPPIPRPPDYPVERRLAMEVQTIGYNTTRHPLYPLRHLYSIMGLTEAGALHTKAGRRVRLLGWLIASKNIDTREGAFMAFLSLEDLSGTFEVVLFPAVYQRCGALLRDRGPYLVAGRVAEENGCHTVIAEWIRRIRAEESPPIAPLPCQ
jgi:DNA polymerase III alpha subunit